MVRDFAGGDVLSPELFVAVALDEHALGPPVVRRTLDAIRFAGGHVTRL
jgi:hypothetical protein